MINLAELQVFRGEQNIALRKKARQSSNFDTLLVAERAVDGNTVGNDRGNPYAHTWGDSNPWWEVDLGNEQAIDRIVVWNRNDAGVESRMNHSRVRVLDRSRKVVFEQVVDKAPHPSSEIARPVFLANATAAPAGANQPLLLQLPLKEAPYRVRVSVATSLADLGPAEARQLTDPWLKLAAAYAMNGRNDEASRYFAKALGRAGSREARKPILELAARFDDLVSGLVEQQPDNLSLQLALARNLARQGQQRLAENRPVEALAALKKSREVSTRLRTKYPQPQWTVLAPMQMKSNAATTLTLQRDGSILASGRRHSGDFYRRGEGALGQHRSGATGDAAGSVSSQGRVGTRPQRVVQSERIHGEQDATRRVVHAGFVLTENRWRSGQFSSYGREWS